MTVTTNEKGEGGFEARFDAAGLSGALFSSTATDPSGNTSEFSQCKGELSIEHVEFTQAIQQLESVRLLQERGLQGPPVPIVKGKPAAMRVMLTDATTFYIPAVEIEAAGSVNDTKPFVQLPGCGAEQQRKRTSGCEATDFYFTPGDQVDVTLKLTWEDHVLDLQTFTFTTVETRPVTFVPVSICDLQLHGGDFDGEWGGCDEWRKLPELLSLFRALAPTADVRLGFFLPGVSVIRLD